MQQQAMTSLASRLLSSLANGWSENEVDAQQPDGCAGAFAKPEPAFMKGTLSSKRFILAVELPAAAIGTQWPMPNSRMKRMSMRIFCWMVMMDRIGAMNPKVQDPRESRRPIQGQTHSAGL